MIQMDSKKYLIRDILILVLYLLCQIKRIQLFSKVLMFFGIEFFYDKNQIIKF